MLESGLGAEFLLTWRPHTFFLLSRISSVWIGPTRIMVGDLLYSMSTLILVNGI